MSVKELKVNEAGVMYRRIRNTLYKVRVYTRLDNGETAAEKILRLAQKEARQNDLLCGNMKVPQMSQPPERSSK